VTTIESTKNYNNFDPQKMRPLICFTLQRL